MLQPDVLVYEKSPFPIYAISFLRPKQNNTKFSVKFQAHQSSSSGLMFYNKRGRENFASILCEVVNGRHIILNYWCQIASKEEDINNSPPSHQKEKDQLLSLSLFLLLRLFSTIYCFLKMTCLLCISETLPRLWSDQGLLQDGSASFLHSSEETSQTGPGRQPNYMHAPCEIEISHMVRPSSSPTRMDALE